MNPQLAALRARHDGLAAEHDGMRAHAVTLVQKCRQAENVNGALQRECARLRGSLQPGGASGALVRAALTTARVLGNTPGSILHRSWGGLVRHAQGCCH